MAIAKFKYGTKEQLNAKEIEDGALYVATDEGKLYVDLNSERLLLTPTINIGGDIEQPIVCEKSITATEFFGKTQTVLIQPEEPTDPNCMIWIKTSA